MAEPIRSRPYSTAMACEACVFGRGHHSEFCQGPPTERPDIASLGVVDIAMRRMEERGRLLAQNLLNPQALIDGYNRLVTMMAESAILQPRASDCGTCDYCIYRKTGVMPEAKMMGIVPFSMDCRMEDGAVRSAQ